MRDYEGTLAREIFGATLHVDQKGVHQYRVRCRFCGDTPAFTSQKRMPPEVVRSKLARLGWTFGKRHHECPGDHRPADKRERTHMPANDPKPALAVVPPAAPVASDAAKAARRDAMRWLDEAFNPSTGTYSTGISDASIAAETKLSVEAVAALREDFFGPLKLPTEVEAALGELAAIETSRVAMQEQAARDFQKLDQRIAEVRSRIERLAAKNGWKV